MQNWSKYSHIRPCVVRLMKERRIMTLCTLKMLVFRGISHSVPLPSSLKYLIYIDTDFHRAPVDILCRLADTLCITPWDLLQQMLVETPGKQFVKGKGVVRGKPEEILVEILGLVEQDKTITKTARETGKSVLWEMIQGERKKSLFKRKAFYTLAKATNTGRHKLQYRPLMNTYYELMKQEGRTNERADIGPGKGHYRKRITSEVKPADLYPSRWPKANNPWRGSTTS